MPKLMVSCDGCVVVLNQDDDEDEGLMFQQTAGDAEQVFYNSDMEDDDAVGEMVVCNGDATSHAGSAMGDHFFASFSSAHGGSLMSRSFIKGGDTGDEAK